MTKNEQSWTLTETLNFLAQDLGNLKIEGMTCAPITGTPILVVSEPKVEIVAPWEVK